MAYGERDWPTEICSNGISRTSEPIDPHLPQFGKPDSYDSFALVVLMKSDPVYRSSNGLLREEPAARYKEWMVKHQYDPEHGKNEPVAAAPEPAAAGAAGASAPK
jgi:hypothetical protein